MSDYSAEHLNYAAPWKRLAAFAIDLPVLAAAGWGCRMLFPQLAGLEWLVGWLYCAGLECSGWQATPGKRALGLKVGDLQGNRVGFVKTSVRYGAKLISLASLGAGFAPMFFTERRQAFHDYAAGCILLDERHQGTASTTPP